MEDYVFQVRKEEDGRLDLSQVTILDRTTGQKSPPHLLSALPERPLHFFDLPWQSEFLGNVLQDEPPQTWTWAWYLVAQRGPSRRDGLDLENGRLVLDVRSLTPPIPMLVEAALAGVELPSVWEYQSGSMELPEGPEGDDEDLADHYSDEDPVDDDFWQEFDGDGGLEDFDTPVSDL
ncbi:hypothetical protein QBZ16_000637 [Prototheca wickerhamii]|uniref:Uncharacterized protein n=1 Tax=Prototheca wickerhamii TaxID=3111 RepID=A0AAD9ILX9_PROWI|nr:hypothetical protein QBZ16_000637 [Prototheca wickerhamii]